jgi:SAM-dependent methyltransferase
VQRWALFAVLAWFAAGAALAQPRLPDVIFVPTPQEVVEDMLRLAELSAGDVLYDLGSGDGRIPITAAIRGGVRAVGIDIDPYRVDEARENARRAGVGGQVDFRLGDVLTADFREATVVTLFLLPELNLKLRPRLLRELQPGTRIVSHQFDMGDWRPDRQLVSNGRTLYFWTIPSQHSD